MKQLESQFKVLRDQAIVLRQTFNTFNHLFESDGETDRVLKESAAWFFYDLNRMMVEYLILLVCRLTDPPETFGKPNSTIPRMTELLCKKEDLDHGIKAKLKTLDANISDYRKRLQPVRNKIVGHSDLDTYVSNSVLGAHPKEKMVEFFENLQSYFDVAGVSVGVGPLDFRSSPGPGDVLDLIHTLKRGLGLVPIKD